MIPRECIDQAECEQMYFELVPGESVYCDRCDKYFICNWVGEGFRQSKSSRLYLPPTQLKTDEYQQ